MIACLVPLWFALLWFPHYPQAQESAQELSNVPATMDVPDGSPVALSEARRVLLRPSLGTDGVREIVIRAETTIENNSGRAIRQIYLTLCFGGNKTGFTAVYRIGPSEVR